MLTHLFREKIHILFIASLGGIVQLNERKCLRWREKKYTSNNTDIYTIQELLIFLSLHVWFIHILGRVNMVKFARKSSIWIIMLVYHDNIIIRHAHWHRRFQYPHCDACFLLNSLYKRNSSFKLMHHYLNVEASILWT